MSEHLPVVVGRERWLLLIWAVALFGATLLLHTRQNSFPYFYHPDEPGKVEQVLTGRWNFNHPMLLLSATRAITHLARVPPTEQAVAEAGRWVSAACTATAVVALSVLAFAWRGWGAGVATGGALLTHHQLFELSHYFKEDPALLAGLALTFLMLLACSWQATPWRAALLGMACGLAVSGKYLGVIAIPLAAVVLWRQPERRGRRFAAFGGALLATFIALNLPLLLQLTTFRASLGREVEFVVEGQRGLTRSVPHTQYWNVFRDNATPVIWVLLAAFLHARWRERRTLSLPEWILIVFPFAYAVALSFSPKTNDRYFLPASALLTMQAAIGAVDLVRHYTRRQGRWRWTAAAGALLVLTQLFSLPPPLDWRCFADYWRAYQVDDHAELRKWVSALPTSAVIAKDQRVSLPDPDKKRDVKRMGTLPQKVLGARFAADLGTMEELRAKGVTHVVVSESEYGRFFLPGLRPQEGERAEFDRRKAFYESLLRDGELLWERDRGTVIYLHPGARVYRLPPL